MSRRRQPPDPPPLRNTKAVDLGFSSVLTRPSIFSKIKVRKVLIVRGRGHGIAFGIESLLVDVLAEYQGMVLYLPWHLVAENGENQTFEADIYWSLPNN